MHGKPGSNEKEHGTTACPVRRWAELCAALGATTSKLAKRALLADCLRDVSMEDAARIALYTAGEAFSEIDPRQLGVGSASLGRAVTARTGADAKQVSEAMRRHGDIGEAAGSLFERDEKPVQGPGLLLADLEEALDQLASARGPQPKQRLLQALLARASALEAKYILKLLAGDLRIGVKVSLVEEAIAVAWERELAAVRHASMLLGSLPQVVQRAAQGTLTDATMRLFHPLGFMLASPVDSVEEAVERFAEEVAAKTREGLEPASALDAPLREAQMEDKYDGIRVQLHAGDPENPRRVGLFSRNREDLRAAFPELVGAFAALDEAVILDGEVLAWSPENGRALPFSSLQTRLGRKVVSAQMLREVPVVFMAFDLLYADGRLWIDAPLRERRARLETYIAQHSERTRDTHVSSHAQSHAQSRLFADETAEPPGFPRLLLAAATQLASAGQLDAAYTEARARGNEGVMLKSAASLYQTGRRGLAWLKLKRELATLDVVVTGAEFGHGRRAGYLSDYTFAVRAEDGTLQNVGKAYSGITDAEMRDLSAHFHETTLEDFGHFRTVEPDTIFEVAFNNITRSDRHDSGFALRFPRILRIRTDKPVEEIDTVARVEEIYNEQPDKPV